MRVVIVGLLVLALGAAGVATFLIRKYSKPQEEVVSTAAFRVLVATRTIQRGDSLSKSNLGWQDWPESGLSEKFIAVDSEKLEKKRLKDFSGAIARFSIAKGEPILADKTYKSAKPALMAGLLDPGMRAVSVSVNMETSASGFVFPGDRVDVLLTHDKVRKALDAAENTDPDDPGAGSSSAEISVLTFATETILRNVRVIAIDQKVKNPEGKPAPAKTITLAVTPKQAEILATARAMGKLSLSLRSLATPADENTKTLTTTTDVEVSPMIRILNSRMKEQGDEKMAAERAQMEAEQAEFKMKMEDAAKEMKAREKKYKNIIRELRREKRNVGKEMEKRILELEKSKELSEQEKQRRLEALEAEKRALSECLSGKFMSKRSIV